MGDDIDVVKAFASGERSGGDGDVHIENDILYLQGWWFVAFRVAADVYLVHAEDPPVPTDVVDRLTRVLAGQGLERIPGDHPLAQAVTYAELSIVHVDWALWAPDAATGSQALRHRASPESAMADWTPGAGDDPALGDLSAEFARSMQGGLPASVILAVGLDPVTVLSLEQMAPECSIEARPWSEAVAACGRIIPHVVVVDASDDEGRQFLLEFKAEACGRHVPVAAVTTDALPPPGADTVLDPRKPPSSWQEELVKLLPTPARPPRSPQD